MSLVYITHHNENIFDIEREPERPQSISKAQRAEKSMKANEISTKAGRFAKELRGRLDDEYRKHNMMMMQDGVRLLTDAKKAHHSTMGCPHVPLNSPGAFLKKNHGVKWRRENLHVCPKGGSMPPLPECAKIEKKPDMAPNFILRNIKCARNTVRCPPPPRFVDTPVGNRQNLLNSGMVPQYVCRKDFGQVPVYLKKTKKMLSAAQAECCKEQRRLMDLCGVAKKPEQLAQVERDAAPPGMRIMDQKERDEILVDLRGHLGEMTKQYQSMSLLIDSESKRQRKSKLESDLRQVEQDIRMLESCPIIYVSLY